MDIRNVEIRFLQNHGAWIFAPENVRIEISRNGKRYKEIHQQNFFNHQGERSQIRLVKKLLSNAKGRYIKITAENFACPKWHAGYESPSWLFVDEVVVE